MLFFVFCILCPDRASKACGDGEFMGIRVASFSASSANRGCKEDELFLTQCRASFLHASGREGPQEEAGRTQYAYDTRYISVVLWQA